MPTFRESKTAKNLLISYAFESQATTRYKFFADQAKRDGFIQIAAIFNEVADQECEHALRFFKFFNGGDLEVTARFLTGVVKNTTENLLSAADLEHYVHSDLYAGFAAVAREEGFSLPADVWDAISVAEVQHEETFRTLAENITSGRIFSRETGRAWRCMNCGYIHHGKDAISVAEVQHEETFRTLAENITSDRIFARDSERAWRCMNCGYIHHGKDAPQKCPACVRPSNYFELFVPNW